MEPHADPQRHAGLSHARPQEETDIKTRTEHQSGNAPEMPKHLKSLVLAATAAPAHAFACLYNGPIVSDIGNYLDNAHSGGSTTVTITWYYNGAPNQQWCLQAASGGGMFVHPDNDVTGLCLDAHTYRDGQSIWVYTCNGSDAQVWCWNGNGYFVAHGDRQVGLKDLGVGNPVVLSQGAASQWHNINPGKTENC